jgi:hypothetical protein
MLGKARHVISLLLIAVLVILFVAPPKANAVVSGKESYVGKEVIFSEFGGNTSNNLRKALADYNISVKQDTLLEIIQESDGDGTVLCATDVNGELVTKTMLMAVGEDGNLQSFTVDDIASVASTDLSGGDATVDPFSNSFQIVFVVSYYAYPYSSDPIGIVQPQTAMFIYMDDNNLYTLSKLTMNYDCHGDEGYFDGVNFTVISGPLDGYKYRITKSQTNPRRNTYYSNTDPIASNKAVLVDYFPDGGHEVVYTIVGVRNSDGASINVTGYVPLELYP